jgi:hypothetical protein
VAADFLGDPGLEQPLHEAAAVEGRKGTFVATRIVLEPIPVLPSPVGTDDFGMLEPVHGLTRTEHQVPQHAPGRLDLVLLQQTEQPPEYLLALALACATEQFGAMLVKAPPDQLEVEAEREDASVRPHVVPRIPIGCPDLISAAAQVQGKGGTTRRGDMRCGT